MSAASNFRDRLIFLAIVVFAFSLSCLYFNQTIKFIQPCSGCDSYFYLQWARDIIWGKFWGDDVFYAMPLYPYFLSLAYIFAAGEIFDLILIQMLIGAINCGLIYILGKRCFNQQVGIIAAIIACTYQMFIFYNRLLSPTTLAIFLGLVFAILALRIRGNPSLKKWFGAGLVLGFCALAYASFILSSIFILCWIIYEYRKKGLLRKSFLYSFSFISAFIMIIAGVTLRNYLVAADPVLITAHSGINFYIGNNPQANGLFNPPLYIRPTQSGLIEDARIVAEKTQGKGLKASEVSNFWASRAWHFIKDEPLRYLGLLGRKFILFCDGNEYVDDIEYYMFEEETGFLRLPFFRFSLICPLALLGIFLSWPQRKEIMVLYGLIFSLIFGTVLFFVNARYRLMVVPYLIIFAAYGLWQSTVVIRSKKNRHFIFSLLLFLIFYFFVNIGKTGVAASGNFVLHYNKGLHLADRQEYQKAQEEFRTALKINPLHYLSYFGLGNIYYELKDFSAAIDSYQRSLAINPIFYTAHYNLGVIYLEMGDMDQAEREFKEVLKFSPGDCEAHYYLGKIYEQKRLNQLALKEYKRALQSKPNSSEIHQAIQTLEGGIEYAPDK